MRNRISVRINGVLGQYPTSGKPTDKGSVERESHPTYGGRNVGQSGCHSLPWLDAFGVGE